MANLRTNNLSGEQGQNAYRGSVQFNGIASGEFLTLASSSDFDFSTGDVTVEAWVFMSTHPSHSHIFSTSNFDLKVSGGQIRLFTSSGETDTSRTVTVGQWHHIAAVRGASINSGNWKVYLNGIGVNYSLGSVTSGDSVAEVSGRVRTDDEEFHGFISNLRVVNGTAVYTSDFTPPTSELSIIPNTVLLCCQDSDDPTQEAAGKTITANGNLTNADFVRDQPKVIPPYGVDAGNAFGGPIQQSSQGYMYFPTGRTEERGRGRGLIVANYIAPANTNVCESITIQSMGNSQDFGDAAAAVRGNAVFASSTRAVSGSGYVAPANVNTIEFFTIATQSNSTNFGDLNGSSGNYTPISNETRGIFAGGYAYPALFNNIDFVTIATTGDSTDFGGLTTLRADSNRTAVNSTTRGLIGGGYINPSGTNIIESLTIATTGNSQDFGDLTQARGNLSGFSSNTRGVFAGGSNPTNNIMDFVTIASAGDAIDFGDLICNPTLQASSATSNNIRGVIAGGDNQPANTITNTIQHVTIATTGNAQDFGDCLTTGAYRGMTSDCHGGLS